jgi:hypothetical protein
MRFFVRLYVISAYWLEQNLTDYALCFIERKMRSILRTVYTLIKIFLIYKEVQKGAVAKSYMRKGFPIYE